MRKRNAGFTLVELLVVIGIIAILIAILLPTLSGVRKSANRIACRAQLADIGNLFQMYLNDSRNKLPGIDTMPSVPLNSYPSIAELLKPYTKDSTRVFHCPADAIRAVDPIAPSGFTTYFDREGTSYLYNPRLAAGYVGKEFNDTPQFRRKKGNELWILVDYEPFHGRYDPSTLPQYDPANPSAFDAAAKQIVVGAANFLFADKHVGDLATE